MPGKKYNMGAVFSMLLLGLWGGVALYLSVRNPFHVQSIWRYGVAGLGLISEVFFVLWFIGLLWPKRQ